MAHLSRTLLLAVPCLAAALLAPSPADACRPQPPGLSGSVPANGESYPANAVLLFFGQEVSLDAVTVNVVPPVGNTPPALVLADAPFGLGALVARVEPPPPPGHTVEIAGDFCPPEYMCEPQAISYLVTAADQTAPAAPSDISFDVYDYPDYVSGGGDCTTDSDLGYWLRAGATPAMDGESPVVYTITARKADSPDVVVSHSLIVSDAEPTVVFRLLTEQIAGANPPDALCFDVSAADTALNAAPVPDPVCLPCRYRAESEPADPVSQPTEPEWTAADAFPGGPCKEGAGGGGSSGEGGSGGAGGGAQDDDAVVGCGCELARPPSWAGTPLLLATLLLTATRIRRRRRG